MTRVSNQRAQELLEMHEDPATAAFEILQETAESSTTLELSALLTDVTQLEAQLSRHLYENLEHRLGR